MSELFGQAGGVAPSIDIPGAELRYYPAFLPPATADHYFRVLMQETPWRDEKVFVWGKWHKQPRLIAWYGDADASYTYSGRRFEPLVWTQTLLELRGLVQVKGDSKYNSVLLNFYRDQNDSMGWHSDNEPELGDAPTIASLSLGDTREFLFKHRTDKSLGVRRIALHHGSLLIMSGATQKNWLHAIEKERHPCGSRINLTYRYIYAGTKTRR